ncbi:MAG TPA: hypothetical protein VGQ53_12190 [Chitinophagaceae bacterium]|jgi:hypothetical protein|nr:hypothetical protein [Chitinophagaceae bacterium]
MRCPVLIAVFAGITLTANSQLTILPQAGFENSNTKISYNNLSYFSPLTQMQPKFGLRADYKFKNGFGPFAGIATSRSLVSYDFTNPETGMTEYSASMGNTLAQFQAGLQYTSKPIFFKKQTAANTASKTTETMTSNHSYYSSGCSRSYSGCGSKKSSTAEKTKSQDKGWYLRLQPSAGVGFMPTRTEDLVVNSAGSQINYTYNAGNNKTALLTGMAFEFAKNEKRLFTLNVNYFKGLGDNATSFTSEVGGKTTTTMLNSKLSGWGATLGIPISFTKKPKTTTTQKVEQKPKYDCQKYKMDCRYRCRKTI